MQREDSGPRMIYLASEADTLALGARLAQALEPEFKIYLSGELGSGKTTLVRGLLRALGYAGRVKSPSYALVELYKLSRLDLYHFDFYRFENPQEWTDAGFRDYLSSAAVIVVEWPERVTALLPAPDLEIHLAPRDTGRLASIQARSARGARCLSRAGLTRVTRGAT